MRRDFIGESIENHGRKLITCRFLYTCCVYLYWGNLIIHKVMGQQAGRIDLKWKQKIEQNVECIEKQQL